MAHLNKEEKFEEDPNMFLIDKDKLDKEDHKIYNQFIYSYNELARLYGLIITKMLEHDCRYLSNEYHEVIAALEESAKHLSNKYNTQTFIDGKNYILHELKFTRKQQYHEYLLSEDWKYIRDNALQNAKHKCHLCNSSKRLNVHHKTYNNIYNEDQNMEDLVVLCGKCHKKFHNIG